jgi:hypothetical protein
VPEYSVAPYQGMESTDILFGRSALGKQDHGRPYWYEAIEVFGVRRSIRGLAVTIVLKDI